MPSRTLQKSQLATLRTTPPDALMMQSKRVWVVDVTSPLHSRRVNERNRLTSVVVVTLDLQPCYSFGCLGQLTELRTKLHGGNLAVQEVHIFDGSRGGKSICEDGIGKQDVAEVFGWQDLKNPPTPNHQGLPAFFACHVISDHYGVFAKPDWSCAATCRGRGKQLGQTAHGNRLVRWPLGCHNVHPQRAGVVAGLVERPTSHILVLFDPAPLKRFFRSLLWLSFRPRTVMRSRLRCKIGRASC